MIRRAMDCRLPPQRESHRAQNNAARGLDELNAAVVYVNAIEEGW